MAKMANPTWPLLGVEMAKHGVDMANRVCGHLGHLGHLDPHAVRSGSNRSASGPAGVVSSSAVIWASARHPPHEHGRSSGPAVTVYVGGAAAIGSARSGAI